jgi:hypothetical protein
VRVCSVCMCLVLLLPETQLRCTHQKHVGSEAVWAVFVVCMTLYCKVSGCWVMQDHKACCWLCICKDVHAPSALH